MKYELDDNTQLVLDFFSDYFEVELNYLLSQLILDGIQLLVSQCDTDRYIPITDFEFPDYFGEGIDTCMDRLKSVQIRHLQRKIIAESKHPKHPRNIVRITNISENPKHLIAA